MLIEALSHSSYANDHKANHIKYNERLEFLGDAVLSIDVSNYIFKHCPELAEGELTNLRASLVCEKTLIEFAKQIVLGKYLVLSKGERNNGGAERPSILSDAFEALIAAIYIDGGIDPASKHILNFVGKLTGIFMVLNYIWIAFFLIAFVVALCKLAIGGDTEVFTHIINASFASAKTGFEISLGLTGVLALWLGIMKIGEKGGVIQAFARLTAPVFSKLFPGIQKDHPATGSIFMCISANLLGLDNAATPMGLKAMKELQELNPKKDTASNPMIMFLEINTYGLINIPISIMV